MTLGYLLVTAGAAVGAPLRYLTDRTIQTRHDSLFPWGTFTVNITGCLILGLFVGTALATGPHSELQLIIGTGLCGTLTTYSTLSYETVRLLEQRAKLYAAVNLTATITIGLLALLAGYTASSTLLRI